MKDPVMNRRQCLSLGIKAAAGLFLAQAVPAQATSNLRTLSFYHTHTRECLEITYAYAGIHNLQALKRIDEYLRDFRTGEVHSIDPEVLDILWGIQQGLGCNGTYEVISGYRSAKTNNKLRNNSRGVAKKSLHMKGQAIDIRLRGEKTCQVRDCAIDLKCGGVGYYAKSDFVHIDTGRVRRW